MSELPPAPTRVAWPSWTSHPLVRFVHDRNPFFLLSAVSMFVGFRVVLGALHSAPGDWKTLLGLIGTLQAYEVVLIGLALFLIVRRGLVRDGWILLGIDAVFLVDLTNLNAELYTALPRLGSAVSAGCFGLALAKIGVVCRVLKLRLTPATFLYAAAQLAFLLAMPGVFRGLRSPAAAVSAAQVYAVWWCAGLLLAGGAVVVRRDPRNATSPMAALPGRLYVLLPMVSLLVHLANENRVFWVHFQPANLAPVLLAAVAAVHRFGSRDWQVRASLLLVGLAVAVSVVPDEYGATMAVRVLGLTVTPLRAVLVVGGATVLALTLWHRSKLAATALAGCASLALLGSTPAEILGRLRRFARAVFDLAAGLVPETDVQWGCAAIAGAFVLLAIGAAVSLRARPTAATPPENMTA